MISNLLNFGHRFDALFGKLPEDPNVPKVRGDAFEKVCQWFLKNDPQYSGKFKNVWLWYEWPRRWGEGYRNALRWPMEPVTFKSEEDKEWIFGKNAATLYKFPS